MHVQIWYDFQLEGSPQELQLFLDGFALLRTHSISLLRDGEQLEIQRGEGATALHSGRTLPLVSWYDQSNCDSHCACLPWSRHQAPLQEGSWLVCLVMLVPLQGLLSRWSFNRGP